MPDAAGNPWDFSDPYFEMLAEFTEAWPLYAVLIKQFPELGEALFKAHEDGASESEMTQAMMDTQWWKSRSESQRAFVTDQLYDPATLEQRIDQEELRIAQMANRAGFHLTSDILRDLAENSLRFNFTDDEVSHSISIAAGQTNTNLSSSGTIAAEANGLIAAARSYFLTLDYDSALELARSIFEGRLTKDGAINQFKENAQAWLPHFADSMELGHTLEEATYTYRAHIAKYLDTAPDQIDFTDDRFNHLIDYADPNGNRRTMTLSEMGDWARLQDEYRASDSGRRLATKAGMNILSALGKAAF